MNPKPGTLKVLAARDDAIQGMLAESRLSLTTISSRYYP